ncbi:UNVERIFIED_CONTAM: hypothetical protein FKN15_017695 [Acipenser sinensis]
MMEDLPTGGASVTSIRVLISRMQSRRHGDSNSRQYELQLHSTVNTVLAILRSIYSGTNRTRMISREMIQGDTVTQPSNSTLVKETENTAIHCNYDGTASDLFWYIQDPNQAPQLIFSDYSLEEIPPRFRNRFSASHDKTEKTFHLNITAAVLSDSATYFFMTSGDSISPQQTAESRTEGESVMLSCSYTADSQNIYLYWYRQNSNQALEYILQKGARSRSSDSHTADFAKSRFTSTADSSSTTLTISKLALSDTAIYHCALRTA